jgi:hypothetical protein
MYKYTDSEIRRIGSYSSYTFWREHLAKIAGYPPNKGTRYFPRTDSVFRADGGDFWELLCFSDCEGTIDAQTSEKLSNDFEKYRDKITGQSENFIYIYDMFARAFAKAKNNGCVMFC